MWSSRSSTIGSTSSRRVARSGPLRQPGLCGRFVEQGLIDCREAVERIDPLALDQLLHPTIDPDTGITVVATGLAASPGAASGSAIFDADLATERAADGEHVILVRPETTADDIHGLIHADGVLTARGGMTSHAAVVARGLGKPCVAGCAALQIDLESRVADLAGEVVHEGELITIDGTNGDVMIGAVDLVQPAPNADLDQVLRWADEFRLLRVHANADTPADALRARATVRKASGSAGPSTCSWPRIGCRSSAR